MRHLHPSHLFFTIFLILFFVYPDIVTENISYVTSSFVRYFGGFVLVCCAFFIGLCSYFAFGRFSGIRLGGQDERPQFSMLSWCSMLFAAGMGAGLIFYGAAEPLLHFTQPPPSLQEDKLVADHARFAMAVTYFHWGIHAWALYGIAALSIAYFSFRHQKPMLPSAMITDKKPYKMVIDTIAILAVIFGLVSTLVQGVSLLSSGLENYIGDTITQAHGVVILLILFTAFMFSAATPIGKGIKVLSNINILIAISLMAFIFFAGQTSFVLDMFVTGIGDYLKEFTMLSFNVRPLLDENDWTGSWTITYFLWWAAWCPFVGVFIARISRGRTLKEFMIAVVIIPTVASMFWFATFGGNTLYFEIFSEMPFTEAQKDNFEGIIYALLSKFPLAEFLPLVVMVLIFIFLVTSADSGTFVLGMFTSNGNLEPPISQRLFWGIVLGLVSLCVFIGGEDLAFFRALSILGAIPYLFIMLWQAYIFIKRIRQDNIDVS